MVAILSYNPHKVPVDNFSLKFVLSPFYWQEGIAEWLRIQNATQLSYILNENSCNFKPAKQGSRCTSFSFVCSADANDCELESVSSSVEEGFVDLFVTYTDVCLLFYFLICMISFC